MALEINSQIDRLDLNDARRGWHATAASALVISSDAHSQNALAVTRWGVVQARRAWLTRGGRAEHAALHRNSVRSSAGTSDDAAQDAQSADDKLAEIRRLYFNATKQTIQQDLAKALDLLKSMSTEEERERAAVYMEGLAEMRKDWLREGSRSAALVRARDRRVAEKLRQAAAVRLEKGTPRPPKKR